MKVRLFDNPAEFATRVRSFLLRDECENCVPIGVLDRVVAGRSGVPGEPATKPLLMTVERDDGEVAAVAMQTPPAGLLVLRTSPPAIDAIAAKLAEIEWSGEMHGPAETIDRLAAAYGPSSGRAGRIDMKLRLMKATRVDVPPMMDAGGFLRACTADDLELAAAWCGAFAVEIGDPHRDPRAAAETIVGEGRLHFWIDRDLGQPRAMAAFAGPTPSGVRINHVYTPPEYRKRGYASCATAALTRELLAGGERKFVSLFTDQSNPTSNKIYQQIGYRIVCDFHNWDFEPPASKT